MYIVTSYTCIFVLKVSQDVQSHPVKFSLCSSFLDTTTWLRLLIGQSNGCFHCGGRVNSHVKVKAGLLEDDGSSSRFQGSKVPRFQGSADTPAFLPLTRRYNWIQTAQTNVDIHKLE